MGNRAIVKPEGKNIGVYLHWNGGIDSVTAFLKYCELRDFRGFDDEYGVARFCQVVGNFFEGGLSLGVMTNVGETEEDAYGLDNGIYVVKDWEIVRNIGGYGVREGYDMDEFLKTIDHAQPDSEQLGDYLDGVETMAEDVKVGDIVFIQNLRGKFEKHEVVGIDEKGPYIDLFNGGPDNPNNYIPERVRKVKE